MKKLIVSFGVLILLVVGVGAAFAEGYPWRDHAAPYDWSFGNHIDTHQQSKVPTSGILTGHFYIKFSGDYRDGVPAAEHADCGKVTNGCTVGWKLTGIPMQAQFVEHPEGQHPTWCVDPRDLPRQPGYTHFHWLGQQGHPRGNRIQNPE